MSGMEKPASLLAYIRWSKATEAERKAVGAKLTAARQAKRRKSKRASK